MRRPSNSLMHAGAKSALRDRSVRPLHVVQNLYNFDCYAAGGNRKVAEWVQGEPKGSFWHGVDLSSASQIPIVTYRCAACGYLEFYARGKELGLIP